jgi:hypothetical protein
MLKEPCCQAAGTVSHPIILIGIVQRSRMPKQRRPRPAVPLIESHSMPGDGTVLIADVPFTFIADSSAMNNFIMISTARPSKQASCFLA